MRQLYIKMKYDHVVQMAVVMCIAGAIIMGVGIWVSLSLNG